MPAAFVHFLARRRGRKRHPLGNCEKFDGIFSRASRARGRVSPMASFIVRIANEIVSDAKVVTFALKSRNCDLAVKKLR